MEMVQKDLTPYYTKYGKSQKYDKEFKEAERLARKEKLGIWGDPELTQKYLRLKSKWGQHRSELERAPPTVSPVLIETGKLKYAAGRKSECCATDIKQRFS